MSRMQEKMEKPTLQSQTPTKSKGVYIGIDVSKDKLNEAVQTTLGMDDHERAFKLAQQVSKAAKQVQDTANYLSHQQKQIEQQHF